VAWAHKRLLSICTLLLCCSTIGSQMSSKWHAYSKCHGAQGAYTCLAAAAAQQQQPASTVWLDHKLRLESVLCVGTTTRRWYGTAPCLTPCIMDMRRMTLRGDMRYPGCRVAPRMPRMTSSTTVLPSAAHCCAWRRNSSASGSTMSAATRRIAGRGKPATRLHTPSSCTLQAHEKRACSAL
jgi:hypothetical protein